MLYRWLLPRVVDGQETHLPLLEVEGCRRRALGRPPEVLRRTAPQDPRSPDLPAVSVEHDHAMGLLAVACADA